MAATNLVGQILNRYKLLSLMGEGGMGSVYRGRDITLQRQVAIKVLHSQFARQLNFQDRFLQEARTAARLNHAGIVPVYDFGFDRSLLYIVMKFIPGDNLEKILRDLKARKKWIPLGEAMRLIKALALALDYAHNKGIYHRDVKPGNIMFELEPSEGLPYHPVLTDLGLAKLAESGFVTQDGISMGTPAYMSPEQAEGKPTDGRSDVYSLGVLLFELATARLPFPAKTISQAIRYHVYEPVPTPHSIRPDLPEGVEATILKALAKDPAERYPSAVEFAKSIEEVLPIADQVTSDPALFVNLGNLLQQVQNRQSEEKVKTMDENYQPTSAAPQDSIQVVAQNQTSKSVAFKPGGMTLGRDKDNDIVLDDTLASRHHARIDFDGKDYRVVDLESTNGTFLQNKKLIPGIPEIWSPDQSLRIGNTWMNLQRAQFAPVIAPQPATAPASESSTTKFASDLYPQKWSAGQVGQVRVRNLGKQMDTFTVMLRDRGDEFHFQPTQATMQVLPGQTAAAEFRANPKGQRWLGGAQTHSFSAIVKSGRGETQTHQGELTSKAIIPIWVLPVFLVLCLGMIGLGILAYYGLSGSQPDRIEQTTTALAALEISAQQTVAVGEANSATATVLAATALAQGDDDVDGLSNAQEAALGTNPSNPDTDGDGLLDGAEVNQYGTDPKNQDSDGDALPDGKEVNEAKTSPKNPDTDGDGVNDGAEVANNTNPLDPDTDHDGIPDGTDAAPIHTSTPSPDTAATAQAAANKTAAAQTAAAQQTNAALTAAANATSTAQMAATLTAQAQAKIIYIYKTDLALANTFKNLLQANGYIVDTIQQSAVASTNYSPYRVIIIGPDTGNPLTWTTGPWGDPAGSEAGYIDSSGKPILGLGSGGALFFEARNLYISYGNCWTTSDTSVYAVNTSHRVWTSPHSISIPGSQIVGLYSSAASVRAVYLPGPIAGITTIGQQTGEIEHFPIIVESGKYLLWGFENGPSNMNNTGRKVFLNSVNYLAYPFVFPIFLTTLVVPFP